MVTDYAPTASDLGFDPDAIRSRYLAERAKRLPGAREERGGAADPALVVDPYITTHEERPPLVDEVDVVVVGGGFTGLITAARLRQAGIRRVRIIEKAADFGGVWYWNRYPGIRCDVDSYIYLPLLEEVGGLPSEQFVEGDEIRRHCQSLAERFGLYEDACLQTRVTALRWDEDDHVWVVSTDRGDAIRARFVCLGSGLLDQPQLPDVPGLETFGGRAFHSSRWDYGYTGGDSSGGLSGLEGQRVAVVGTAASAVQLIPIVAQHAAQLLVVQRTPAIVEARKNKATDVEWFTRQPPGWQRERTTNFTAVVQGTAPEVDLVSDSTTDLFKSLRRPPADLAAKLAPLPPDQRRLYTNYARMEAHRARIDDLVDDPRTAEALKPYYNVGCKRPQFSDSYLQTFNRPNVTLIDTQGRGLERVTAGGLVAGGAEWPVDCIIFATGFAPTLASNGAAGFPVTGRDDQPLEDKWRDGVVSLHGIHTSGFPNLFVVGRIAQAALTINFSHILDEQARYVAGVVGRSAAQGVEVVEVQPQAEQRWAAAMAEAPPSGAPAVLECTPGDHLVLLGSGYGGGPLAYMEICRDWLDDGFERDLTLTRARPPRPPS